MARTGSGGAGGGAGTELMLAHGNRAAIIGEFRACLPSFVCPDWRLPPVVRSGRPVRKALWPSQQPMRAEPHAMSSNQRRSAPSP
ncbi:hypothetical protein GCM10009661_72870 [Catellatospora chokoriensis]